MATLALIGLGSNLGDRKATLDGAIAALAETPEVTVRAVSSYHETKPVGGPAGQGAFLNAAARVETTLGPFELLRALQGIEDRAGRIRAARWGERTLDLDLLIYACKFLDTPDLKLPHPRLGVRRFVLAPLAEIAPTIVDTTSSLTIAQLLSNLDRRPSYVALDGPASVTRSFLFDMLSVSLPAVGIQAMAPGGVGASPPNRLRGYFDDLSWRALPLDEALWVGERPAASWVISDYCLALDQQTPPTDALGPIPRGGLEPDQAAAIRDTHARALQACARALRPTFAVLLGGPAPGRARRPRFAPFPTLWPDSDDPEAVTAEVLAACAATRGG